MRKRTIILTLAIVILAVALGACARQSQKQSAEQFLAGQPTEQVGSRAVLVPAGNIAVTGNGKAMTFPSGSSLTADSGATVVFNAAVSLAGGISASGGLAVTGPTAAATATPALYVNNLGAANDAFVVADASTPLAIVGQSGVTINSNVVQNAPTAATTATPGYYLNNVGVANDALVVADAGTPVAVIGQAGAVTLSGGVTGQSWVKITGPTAAATATPAFVVDNIAAGANALEVRDAATPMFVVGQAGAWTGSGTGTQNNTLWVTVPTEVTTATPGFMVNNQGATNNAFEVRDAATPVFQVGQAGAWTHTGAGTLNDSLSGAWAIFTAPTAIATATPAFRVNNLGAANDAFVVEDSATPVFRVGQAGVLSNPLNGFDIYDDAEIRGQADTVQLSVRGYTTQTNQIFVVEQSGGGDMFTVNNSGNIVVEGTSNLKGNVSDSGGNLTLDDTVDATGALNVTGALAANGGIAVDTSVFTVADSTGNTYTNGTLSVNSTTTTNDDITITNIAENGATRDQFIGLPRIKLVGLGQGTNSISTTAYITTTPLSDWSEVDAGTNLALTADTTYYRDATANSLKMAFTNVITGDGMSAVITAENLNSEDYLGFWLYSSAALTSGDFAVTLDGDGTDQSYNVSAAAANSWIWVELDISGCDLNCDNVTGIKFLATSQGGTALTAANVYVDAMYSWDAADEESFKNAMLYDGVLGMVNTESGVDLTEWTDYIVTYRAGNDYVVWIGNMTAADLVALIAY